VRSLFSKPGGNMGATGSAASALEKVFGEASSTKIIWRPKSTVTVEGETVATLMRLLDALEDDDDVQNVYSNEDISDADMAKLG
jgi:transcriptional/translational regulatory protein YebC/TACO1